MKNKLIVMTISLVVLLSACGPSPKAIQAAVDQTLTAHIIQNPEVIEEQPTLRPSLTPRPSNTTIPTRTAKATQAPTFTQAPDLIQEDFRLGIKTLLESGIIEGVETVNLVRFAGRVIEVEVKTQWASKDRQPGVSYEIVQAISLFTSDWERLENRFFQLLGSEGFDLSLTSYSTDGDYRYSSFSSFETLMQVEQQMISYEEWADKADAGFK